MRITESQLRRSIRKILKENEFEMSDDWSNWYTQVDDALYGNQEWEPADWFTDAQKAYSAGMTPQEYIDQWKKKNA